MSSEVHCPLSVRVQAYYLEQVVDDGQGGRLKIKDIAEFAHGIVAVLDTLSEIDLFYDLDLFKITSSTSGVYSNFLEDVADNAEYNRSRLGILYGMTVISESCWFPFYKRTHSSFELAADAAKNYLISRDDTTVNWYFHLITLDKMRLQ